MSNLSEVNSATAAVYACTPIHSVQLRDEYGAITDICIPKGIHDLVSLVRQTAGWETGITSEGMRRGGYEARSIDVYGYDTARRLAVIQIRRTWKKKDGWFPQVSKSYALVGMDGEQIFSHPLDVSPRRNRRLPTMTPDDVVRWAEAKIFGVTEDRVADIIRQGDVALIPVRAFPPGVTQAKIPVEGGVKRLTLRDHHCVMVDGEVFEDDYAWYAHGLVEIEHTKGEHRAVCGEGRFKIVEGRRGEDPWWANLAMGD